MKANSRIPELDGFRAILIFVVSWYHIWQQSWLTPSIGSIYLDFFVRTGYMWVDGAVLLSAFLLFLPWARAKRDGTPLPDRIGFYKRRALRVLPSYYFLLLAVLFAVVLPYGLYTRPQFAVKDLFTHFTFTFTFWADTYLSTPLGVACWTLAIEVQAYLLFPWIAKAAVKHPARTLIGLAAAGWAFRGWCLWSLTDVNLVLNQLPSFLDVYALGMLCAFLYVRLERLSWKGTAGVLGRIIATLCAVIGVILLINLLKLQARSGDNTTLQRNQMIRRLPLACIFSLIMVSLPFMLKPFRLLFGNPVMRFLGGISMNYYLIHQTVAVHLKRMGIPYSESELPNQTGDINWQFSYTWLAFGLSLALAIAVTYGIEKPAAKYLRKRWKV